MQGLGAEEVAPVAAALVDRDCTLSGETVIAAGGRMARAAMLCTDAVPVPADPAALNTSLATLAATPTSTEHDGAVAMFGAFMAGN